MIRATSIDSGIGERVQAEVFHNYKQEAFTRDDKACMGGTTTEPCMLRTGCARFWRQTTDPAQEFVRVTELIETDIGPGGCEHFMPWLPSHRKDEM